MSVCTHICCFEGNHYPTHSHFLSPLLIHIWSWRFKTDFWGEEGVGDLKGRKDLKQAKDFTTWKYIPGQYKPT